MKKRVRYSALALATVLSFALFAPVNAAAESPLVPGSHLTIDGDYIRAVPARSYGRDLIKNFTGSVTGVAENAMAGTGLNLAAGGRTYTIVVTGDVNGDARITSADYLSLKKNFNAQQAIESAAFAAADTDGDSNLTTADYIRIKRQIKGSLNLFEGMEILPEAELNIVVEGDGTAVQEGSLLKVTPAEGCVLADLTADGVKVFVTDGEVSTEKLRGRTVRAVFEKAADATADATEPMEITNTFYDEAASEYGICWRTEDYSAPVVKFLEAGGKTPEEADFGAAKVVTAYSEEINDYFTHRAALTGLKRNVKYYYIVGDEATGSFSEVCSVTPADPSDGRVVLLHMSDTQDDTNRGLFWGYDLKMALETYPDTDMIVNTGDIVQTGGDEEDWIKMLEFAFPYIRDNVLIGVAGNHDYWSGNSLGKMGIINSHFTVDLPDGQSTDYGTYYSFDYGDIHFVVLNTGDTMVTGNEAARSGRLTDSQLEWVKQDLAAAKDMKWKIVALHNPLYSPGKYGSDTTRNAVALALRQQLDPVFAEYGVDLVMNGHDHCYSVSYPISGESMPLRDSGIEEIDGVKYFTSPEGPVHLMSGTGGEQIRGALDKAEALSTFAFKIENGAKGFVNYSAIVIEGNKLTVKYYNVACSGNKAGASQKLLHSWGIVKE